MSLEVTLAELEKTALIRRVEDAEPTFFHHTLTQESIYRSLLKPTRREMHLAVARAYEELYVDQLDIYAALLAEHYAVSQEDTKTVEYSARAGDAAMRVYANAEVQAVDYGEQSLVISRDLGMREQTAYALNDLFRPYNSLGQSDRARAVSEQAREYFRESGNQPMLADNLGRSTVAHVVFGEFDLALALSAEACQISEAIGNPWGQSFSQMLTGNIYFQRGEMTRAIDTMRVSIRLGQASGFLMPQIWTNADLAALYGELGGVDRGIELASQSYTLAAERFPRGMSRVHGVLARLSLLRGDVRQAESHVEQGKANFVNDFAQRAFDRLLLIEIEYVRVFQSALEYLKGKALLARGDAESAREMLLHALTEAEKIGSRWMLRQIYAALGERERACELVNFIAVNTPENLARGVFELATG